jgi:hypothetical protein
MLSPSLVSLCTINADGQPQYAQHAQPQPYGQQAPPSYGHHQQQQQQQQYGGGGCTS